MKIFEKRTLLKIAALAASGVMVSGCVYDVGLGYASDGYYDDYYWDPYGGYDSYFDCDYGSGFYNIGFGGGWYDNYYYPGHGYYLFDNYGRRHAMRDHHRRYWGEKRHSWYREHGGRVRDGGDNRRGDGRRQRGSEWRGGDGNGADAVPPPNPDHARGDGRRGDGQGRGHWRGNDNPDAAPRPDRVERRGEDGRATGAQGNWRQRAPQRLQGQSDAPAARPAAQPSGEGDRQEAPRHRAGEGRVKQPD